MATGKTIGKNCCQESEITNVKTQMAALAAALTTLIHAMKDGNDSCSKRTACPIEYSDNNTESSVEPPPTRPAASLHRRGGRRAPRWHNCVHNCQRW